MVSNRSKGRGWRTFIGAAALATLVGGFAAAPALAYGGHRDGRGFEHGREWHGDRGRGDFHLRAWVGPGWYGGRWYAYPYEYYAQPPVVYAPPPVVYAPPRAYYPGAFNFSIW